MSQFDWYWWPARSNPGRTCGVIKNLAVIRRSTPCRFHSTSAVAQPPKIDDAQPSVSQMNPVLVKVIVIVRAAMADSGCHAFHDDLCVA